MVQANINLQKASTTVSNAGRERSSYARPHFQKGELDVSVIQKMIGTIENDHDLSSDFVDMTIAGTSTAATASVKTTLDIGDNTIRVMPYNEKIYTKTDGTDIVKVLDRKGLKIEEIRGIGVHQFSRDEIGTIHVCNFSKKWISRLSSDGRIVDLFSTSLLYPNSLSFTQSGDILVALVNVRNADFDKCKQTCIAKMDIHGREKQRYEYEDDGKTRLFQYAVYVLENGNKDILVIDKIEQYKLRLYILNAEGHIKHSYNGTSQLEKNFMPVSMCCDKYCRILLSDMNNDAIHLLNEKGELLQLLLTRKDGLEDPYSIGLDDDLLCIGTMKGKLIIADYKY